MDKRTWVVAVVLTACGGDDAGGNAPTPVCAPHSAVACVGAMGCPGTQSCNADGSGFTAPCDCGGGVAGSAGVGGGACATSFGDVATKWCGRNKSCDATTDEQTCVNEMSNYNAVKGPKYRCEYMGNLVACFDTKDCVTTLNGSAFVECNEQALALIAPSQIGATFCAAYGMALTNCGLPFDNVECLDVAKIFSDATAQQGQACTMRPCAEIASCVAAAFGGTRFGSPNCSDSCPYAADGFCDDGGVGSQFSLCDFGTDCTDCGPR